MSALVFLVDKWFQYIALKLADFIKSDTKAFIAAPGNFAAERKWMRTAGQRERQQQFPANWEPVIGFDKYAPDTYV